MRTASSPRPAAAPSRLWEIDVARGVAVVLMVFFHLMWDLQFLGLSAVNVFSAPWQAFARGIGSGFGFLMGLALALVGARLSDQAKLWRYALRRGATIFGLGALISLATYVALGDEYVRFGILHMLGAMLIVATAFVPLGGWPAAAAGLTMIALGALVGPSSEISAPWLLPLGIPPAGVAMADYYPLLPWGGPVLLGVAFGSWAYPGGVRRWRLPGLGGAPVARGLGLLGRHSLLIYLAHQPVLLAALFAVRAALARGA